MSAGTRTTLPFRAETTRAAMTSAPPSRRQTIALIAVLVLVAGAVAIVSYVVRPSHSRAFSLLQGSVFIADASAPVAVDLASGKPTMRLIGAARQVGLRGTSDLSVVPSGSGTLLLNRLTGEFNMVDNTGFVIKHDNSGVQLPARSGTTSVGVAAADPDANGTLPYYIVRSGNGETDVFLVDEATVASATNSAKVKPTAGAVLGSDVLDAAGATASAGGDLWLLARSTDGYDVHRLSRPANAPLGAALTDHDLGTVSATAAIGTATTGTTNAGGGTPGTSTVGVAAPGLVRVVDGTSAERDVRVQTPAGLDSILAASSAQDRLTYLEHASAGWYLLSLAADGSDVRGPVLLTGIPADAQLAQPAMSDGRLYTLNKSGGAIYSIDTTGTVRSVRGARTYPIVHNAQGSETTALPDAYVVARGPRVIINSPSHYDAVTIYTDGSRAPYVFEKSSTVDVSASGGTEALTSRNVDTGNSATSSRPRTGSKPKPVTPINNKIDCKTVNQKPSVPYISGRTAGSRSIELSWTYLRLPSSCAPSTYVVTVQPVSGGSSGAPGNSISTTVQGQQSAVVSGLYPLSTYAVSVTAYLNGVGTTSPPVQVTTAKEGPAAPTGLQVTSDDTGNWHVSWNSCGTAAQGCVPAASWKVIPHYCDGVGLSSTPPTVTAPADPNTSAQPALTYPSGALMLGRGLSFQVQGTGVDGSPGAPSTSSACVYSWTTPNTAAMSVSATTRSTDAGSVAATLHFADNPEQDLGGVGATMTYQLLSGGSVVSSVGPITQTGEPVTLTGLQPGQSYAVQVLVSPPHHPEIVATVGPTSPSMSSATWPTITATVHVQESGEAQTVLSIDFTGVSSAQDHGERFDLVNSALVCDSGSGEHQLSANGFDPGTPLSFTFDRSTWGQCKVRLQLTQDSATVTDPPQFSDDNSPVINTSSFTLDQPTLNDVDGSDFSATWDGTSDGLSLVRITYTGGDPLVSNLANSWAVTVTDPNGDQCGSYSGAGSLHDVSITANCVQGYGSSGQNWNATVSFNYLGTTEGPYTVNSINGGAAPTYNTPQVCDTLAAGLAASWSGTAARPAVNVSATDASKLVNCANWSYTVTRTDGPSPCGTVQGAAPPVTITLGSACDTDLAKSSWSIIVGYNDQNGTAQTTTLTVSGRPPS